jgi:uncharacterized SAM-binding protein YcdF (DUF218 family)
MRSLIGYGFLAPLSILIGLCFLGALLLLIWRRTGTAVVLVCSFSLYMAATPAFSSYLLWCIELQIPDNTNLSTAQAIVVLGVDVRPGYGVIPDRLGPQSLERLIMAMEAYHRLYLPLAVSGGRLSNSHASVAELMKSALEQYFFIPVTWSEDHSQTTYEQAEYTENLLREANIRTVVIIAQARDLPRIIWSFEHVGLKALPWPVPRIALEIDRINDFLPTIRALSRSSCALHELIGKIYYKVRY